MAVAQTQTVAPLDTARFRLFLKNFPFQISIPQELLDAHFAGKSSEY